ncbi:hypothetical protein ElyMa_000136600 [Elysia marginata]|uniref:Uncharacterized protein n=1 Tax=Elysia marginata TaxID=1093978 RepID=A0AAV4EPU2_9GAST|nr:hypothetical protein ElyMa_000136600 [Elysia marginata]
MKLIVHSDTDQEQKSDRDQCHFFKTISLISRPRTVMCLVILNTLKIVTEENVVEEHDDDDDDNYDDKND